MKSIKVPGPRPKSRLRRGTLPSRPGGVSADAGPAGGGGPPAVHGGAASGSPPRLGFAPQQGPGDPRLLAEYIVGRLPGKWPRRPAPCCGASARYVASSRRTLPTWPRPAASAGRPPRPSALASTHPVRTPRERVAQHRYLGRPFPSGNRRIQTCGLAWPGALLARSTLGPELSSRVQRFGRIGRWLPWIRRSRLHRSSSSLGELPGRDTSDRANGPHPSPTGWVHMKSGGWCGSMLDLSVH